MAKPKQKGGLFDDEEEDDLFNKKEKKVTKKPAAAKKNLLLGDDSDDDFIKPKQLPKIPKGENESPKAIEKKTEPTSPTKLDTKKQ